MFRGAVVMNKKSFYGGIFTGVLSAAVVFSVLSLSSKGIVAKSNVTFSKENKLNYISDLLNEYYVDDIENEKLAEGAYRGLVAEIGDPYTTYMSASEAESFVDSIKGEFYGIGVGLLYNSKEKTTLVSYVIDESPAEKAGILPGDSIVSVNKSNVNNMDIDTIVNNVRGPKGTTVNIGVYRPSDKKDYSFKIERDNIDLQSVEGEVIDENIGYIYISGFKANTYDQFIKELEELKNQNVKGLVIDLRDNPGGSLDTVVKIADEIIPEGSIVYTVDKKGNKKEFNADANYDDIPLVLLVNENSASASEILSGAVKDRQRGKIVGTTTFGKGLVQKFFGLSDGSGVKITIEKYYTPKGICIQGIGIEPDYFVERQDDLASIQLLKHEDDVQLKKAIEVLNIK